MTGNFPWYSSVEQADIQFSSGAQLFAGSLIKCLSIFLIDIKVYFLSLVPKNHHLLADASRIESSVVFVYISGILFLIHYWLLLLLIIHKFQVFKWAKCSRKLDQCYVWKRNSLSLSLSLYFKCLFIFVRERAHGQGQGERETEDMKQALC